MQGVTSFLSMCVLIALAVPVVSRGSYDALARRRWHWKWMFASSFALQIASEHVGSVSGYDIAFGALVSSYVFLIAFCLRNAIHTGMAVVTIGIALNASAIVVNHGMPVRVPAQWEQVGGLAASVKHHAWTASDRLEPITDIIFLPVTDEVISFGDLILAVGLIDVAFHASRRRSRTRAAVPRAARAAGDVPPTARLLSQPVQRRRVPRAGTRPARRTAATLPLDYTLDLTVDDRRRFEIAETESIMAGTSYASRGEREADGTAAALTATETSEPTLDERTRTRLRHPAGRELQGVNH